MYSQISCRQKLIDPNSNSSHLPHAELSQRFPGSDPAKLGVLPLLRQSMPLANNGCLNRYEPRHHLKLILQSKHLR